MALCIQDENAFGHSGTDRKYDWAPGGSDLVQLERKRFYQRGSARSARGTAKDPGLGTAPAGFLGAAGKCGCGDSGRERRNELLQRANVGSLIFPPPEIHRMAVQFLFRSRIAQSQSSIVHPYR